jgi:hypothetical protein
VEAATQRERQLSDRLRAAQEEIVSLRQWVDQAVAAQTGYLLSCHQLHFNL